MDILRFVEKDPSRKQNFQEMIDKVSMHANASKTLVNYLGKRALDAWELIERKDAEAIVFMSEPDQNREIQKMLGYFRRYMETIIKSEPNLQEATTIAQQYFQEMFVKDQNLLK